MLHVRKHAKGDNTTTEFPRVGSGGRNRKDCMPAYGSTIIDERVQQRSKALPAASVTGAWRALSLHSIMMTKNIRPSKTTQILICATVGRTTILWDRCAM
jgi:hypothetical protein